MPPTGNVYGTALDDDGRPVPRAAVTLVGPGVARKTATDEHGDFRVLGVPPGLQTLEFSRAGLQSVRQEVTVQAGGNVVTTVTLRVAGAAEALAVLGSPPLFDRRKVETGATFNEQELREIPTTRDPSAVVRQVPGVLLADVNLGGGSTAPTTAGFVGKGAHSDQSVVNLEGTGISLGGFSPALFDFDSLDSISVATGGADPALSTPGVTVNLVTKRGTNTIAGSGRGLYTGASQWDYGLQIGGPLWKDHVWLWGAGASNSFLGQTFFLPDAESVRSRETSELWNAKLTAQVVPSNTLSLAYSSSDRLVDGRGAAPNRSEPTTLDVDLKAVSYRVEDTQVLSETLFETLTFAYVPNHRNAVPKGGLDAQADVDADYVWRNSFNWRYTQRTQHQVGLTVSTFLSTAKLRHELKFGFGYRNADNQSASALPADQLVGFAYLDPAQASVTRGINAKFLDNFYDAYLSDTLQWANVTISLGVRFDYEQARNLASAVRANSAFPGLLPAVQYRGDSGYPLTWRSVEPRIGATWAVGRDRQTLLRASYSRFADQLGVEITHVSAFPGIASLDYYWIDANHNGRVEPSELDLSQLLSWGSVNPDDAGSSAPVNQFANHLDPPETDEVILGIERQVSSDLAISLAYTYRRRHGPLFTPWIGTTRASYRYVGNAAGTITDPTTGFVLSFNEPYYGLTTDPAPVGSVLENRPDATETYDGLELQAQKSFSNGWRVRVGVAYNKWRQQIGAGAIVNPNNEVPGTNASGPAVEGDVNATWQFNVGGTAVFPLGIQAGVNFYGRQGFPILYFVEAATHDTLDSFPQLQIGSVGTYRTPNVYDVDLQLSRDFRLGPRVTITPTVAFFNLLGSRTVLSRDGRVGLYDKDVSPVFAPNEAFNAVVESLGGRTIRGGVRISF